MLAHGGHVSSVKANRPDHHLIDFTTAMFVIAAAFPIILFVPRVRLFELATETAAVFCIPPNANSNNSSHDETNPQTRGLCPP